MDTVSQRVSEWLSSHPEYQVSVSSYHDDTTLNMDVGISSVSSWDLYRRPRKFSIRVNLFNHERFTPEEFRYITDHELAHIENGDLDYLGVKNLVDKFWVIIGIYELFRLRFPLVAVSYFLTSCVLKPYLSRRQEYLADLSGSQKSGFIIAIRTISKYSLSQTTWWSHHPHKYDRMAHPIEKMD
jgi:hypothetical protein